MNRVKQMNEINKQTEIQYLIKDWLTREEKQCEINTLISQECHEKQKNMKQSKSLKEMSDKLNKIQRQLLRQQNGNNKENVDKASDINDMQKLLSRANQWFANSRKNKAYLNQMQAQVSSIYNSGADLLQKKNKNEILLQQLKQNQMEIQGQIFQSKNKLKFFENKLQISKIQHKMKIQKLTQDNQF